MEGYIIFFGGGLYNFFLGGGGYNGKGLNNFTRSLNLGTETNIEYGDFTDHYSEKRKIKGSAKIHEKYDNETHANDIAIITLSERVPTSNTIPMCTKTYKDSTLAVCGMGSTKGGKLFVSTDSLLEVRLREVDCHSSGLGKSSESQICLVGDKKDSCHGDSGGPVFPVSETDKAQCLYGVVSYGSDDCDGYGVYSRVSHYLDWIKKNMK